MIVPRTLGAAGMLLSLALAPLATAGQQEHMEKGKSAVETGTKAATDPPPMGKAKGWTEQQKQEMEKQMMGADTAPGDETTTPEDDESLAK